MAACVNASLYSRTSVIINTDSNSLCLFGGPNKGPGIASGGMLPDRGLPHRTAPSLCLLYLVFRLAPRVDPGPVRVPLVSDCWRCTRICTRDGRPTGRH